MSWPKLKFVDCIGFSRKLLPILQTAIDNKEITWLPDSFKLYLDHGSGNFEFAGCIWDLYEVREIVVSIILISGTPNREDLTAMTLKYNIDAVV